MGRAKQLLPLHGRPLVRHVAESVLQARFEPAIVVVGAEAPAVEAALAGLPVRIALNPAWGDGLASSLRTGLDAALAIAPQLDALLVVLADQPGLPPDHLAALVARYRAGGCSAVASLTHGAPVPPLLFDRTWFERLRQLQGDTGARALLHAHAAEVATVPLAANTDLDTPEDYARYTR